MDCLGGRIAKILVLTALAFLLTGLGAWTGAPEAAASVVRGTASVGQTVALPGPAYGSAAIEALGSRLPEVARAYGLTSAGLRGRLAADRHLGVDAQGRLFYADPATGVSEPAVAAEPPAPAPLQDTFRLHSVPGAKRVIYLDFDGHLLTGTAWNQNFNGGGDIVCPPFDFEGGSGVFTTAEMTRIQRIWQRVAEDYAPFMVDVTTEYPGEEALSRSGVSDEYYGARVLISPISNYVGRYGGVAYVGSFDDIGDTYKTALVFPEILYYNEKYVAEAASHETGHNLALWHDGMTTGSAYYTGLGSGETGWAPIMGSGYYQNLTQWSRGEYPTANNPQDDLAVITSSGLSPRADDHADNPAAATPLDGSGTLAASGLVASADDLDLFAVIAGDGTINVRAAVAAVGPNLDIHLELRDRVGSVLAFGNPPDLLGAGLSATVSAGTYYIAVQGTGRGDASVDGYSDYGSLGWYSLSVDVPAGTPNQPPLADLTVAPFSGQAPLSVVFDGSRSTDPDGAIVSYQWDFGDGTVGVGARVGHVYTAPGTYRAVLTVTDDRGASAIASTTVYAYAPNASPVARVSATPTQGQAPLPVQFDGSASSDPDGTLITYSWAFGDGTYGSGQKVQHTYTQAGTYTATLTVVDDGGGTAVASTSVWVQAVNQAPIAKATAEPASGIAPLGVTFDGSGSSDPDGRIVSYSWQFGDGTWASGLRVGHTYATEGVYEAVLTVTDDQGATGTFSLLISAQAQTVQTLYVKSVSVSTVSVRGGSIAQALVTVVDQTGAPVSGVAVSGTFTGSVTNAGAGVTDDAGAVLISSRKTKRMQTVDFVVTSVTKAGYLYVP